jgi:hypothetical protein
MTDAASASASRTFHSSPWCRRPSGLVTLLALQWSRLVGRAGRDRPLGGPTQARKLERRSGCRPFPNTRSVTVGNEAGPRYSRKALETGLFFMVAPVIRSPADGQWRSKSCSNLHELRWGQSHRGHQLPGSYRRAVENHHGTRSVRTISSARLPPVSPRSTIRTSAPRCWPVGGRRRAASTPARWAGDRARRGDGAMPRRSRLGSTAS